MNNKDKETFGPSKRSLEDLRHIEELCVDRDDRPSIVVECPVDDDTTLLIFDVVVPKDLPDTY